MDQTGKVKENETKVAGSISVRSGQIGSFVGQFKDDPSRRLQFGLGRFRYTDLVRFSDVVE